MLKLSLAVALVFGWPVSARAESYPPAIQKCIDTAQMQMNAPGDAKLLRVVGEGIYAKLCWQDKNRVGGPLKQVVGCMDPSKPFLETQDVIELAIPGNRESMWAQYCK